MLLPKIPRPLAWGDTRPITLSSTFLKWAAQLLLHRAGEKVRHGGEGLQWARRGRQGVELVAILRRIVQMSRDWGVKTWIVKLDIRKSLRQRMATQPQRTRGNHTPPNKQRRRGKTGGGQPHLTLSTRPATAKPTRQTTGNHPSGKTTAAAPTRRQREIRHKHSPAAEAASSPAEGTSNDPSTPTHCGTDAHSAFAPDHKVGGGSTMYGTAASSGDATTQHHSQHHRQDHPTHHSRGNTRTSCSATATVTHPTQQPP